MNFFLRIIKKIFKRKGIKYLSSSTDNDNDINKTVDKSQNKAYMFKANLIRMANPNINEGNGYGILKTEKLEEMVWDMENIIGEQIISFEDDSMGGLFVTLAGNPKEYIEQVKQAKHLSSIRVPEVASKQFYDELRELIKNCKDNVKIVNDIGEASIDEFLLGEEIIKNLLDEINT